MNIFIGVGRITKETEINQSGKIASNTIAIDRPLKDQNGNKVTDFINIRWLGEKKTQFAKNYIKKGQKIAIFGSLCIDSYKDRDGNNRQAVYVLVENTEFCESKSVNQQNNNPQQTSNETPEWMNVSGDSDSLPFD